jgi:hypothetical protein
MRTGTGRGVGAMSGSYVTDPRCMRRRASPNLIPPLKLGLTPYFRLGPSQMNLMGEFLPPSLGTYVDN